MKNRVRDLITRILELREEYEDAEFLEAIEHVRTSALANSCDTPRVGRSRSNSKQPGPPRSAFPKASRVVLALKNSDPARYEILIVLDSLLRDGKIIPSVEGIRTIGASLDKSFVAGKSRKEAIPKLMTLLASLPLDQIKEIVNSLLERPHNKKDAPDDEAYSRLAAFLIQGK